MFPVLKTKCTVTTRTVITDKFFSFLSLWFERFTVSLNTPPLQRLLSQGSTFTAPPPPTHTALSRLTAHYPTQIPLAGRQEQLSCKTWAADTAFLPGSECPLHPRAAPAGATRASLEHISPSAAELSHIRGQSPEEEVPHSFAFLNHLGKGIRTSLGNSFREFPCSALSRVRSPPTWPGPKPQAIWRAKYWICVCVSELNYLTLSSSKRIFPLFIKGMYCLCKQIQMIQKCIQVTRWRWVDR